MLRYGTAMSDTSFLYNGGSLRQHLPQISGSDCISQAHSTHRSVPIFHQHWLAETLLICVLFLFIKDIPYVFVNSILLFKYKCQLFLSIALLIDYSIVYIIDFIKNKKLSQLILRQHTLTAT